MKTHEIINPPNLFMHNLLIGDEVQKSRRRLGDLTGLFQDHQSFEVTSPDELVYEVYSYIPADEKSQGQLNFGVTRLYPGKIGREYFMTKGHFHHCEKSTEYYWGIEGEGLLVLMDQERHIRAEKMFPGSLHYIRAGIAHRVVNTGSTLLSFGACWPSDAGHNYDEIACNGFSARVLEISGIPQLISL
ncbi:MAG: glucose-6-phosphate isomerase [Tannerellaceae bacterium]|nr:glucose-6-phosphate isomerase [Tannerellaceae bacterium]